MTVLLALWAYASAGALATVSSRETVLLGWGLIGLTVAAFLIRPFRGAGLLVTILACAGFVAAQVYLVPRPAAGQFPEILASLLRRLPPDSEYLVVAALGVICLAASGLLASGLAARLARKDAQLRRNADLVEDLTLMDKLTGTLKESYASSLIDAELERAKRYGRPLSLLLLGTDYWSHVVSQLGERGVSAALQNIAQTLLTGVRSIDSVSRRGDSRFVVVLPETKTAGAEVVAQRLCSAVASRTSIGYRAGIVEYPLDGQTQEALLDEAEAALGFARSLGLTAASHRLLG